MSTSDSAKVLPLQRLEPLPPDASAAEIVDRMKEAGVLYMQGLLDRGRVEECRSVVIDALRAEGWIKPDGDEPIPAGEVHRIGDSRFVSCLQRVMSDQRIHELAYDDAILKLTTTLLAEQPFVHPRKMVRLSYPTEANPMDAIPAHQDLFYVKGERDTFTFWIPLGDYPVGAGGLRIVEGSHHAGLYPVGPNEEGRFQCSSADVDSKSLEWSSADFRMGDVVVFHSLTLHGSAHNASNAMRLSIDCRYSSATGVVNADQMLPPYHPLVAGWDVLSSRWTARNLFDVPATIVVEDATIACDAALARPSRFV